MAELTYGLNKEGRLVHVDSVLNGLACGCRCPGCGAELVAKNNGETMMAHFAHASGVGCAGALESELHLLAKEVISEEKCVMLPRYGNVYEGGMIRFDEVEIEKRNDVSMLQPDLCGVVHKSNGEDGRLWIEIRVTHAIGGDKRAMIQKENIACVEVNMGRFMQADISVSKEKVREFLLTCKDDREWTNNPRLEKKRMEVVDKRRKCAQDSSERKRLEQMSAWVAGEEVKCKEKTYLDEHIEHCVIEPRTCFDCKYHTTRLALYEECKRRHFPVWVREALACNLKYWTKEYVGGTMEPAVNRSTKTQNGYSVQYGYYLHLLPTNSPDIHGREVSKREINQNIKIIPFLRDTVPAIIASEGVKCRHCVGSFTRTGNRYDIACDMPNVVNRHRRKR